MNVDCPIRLWAECDPHRVAIQLATRSIEYSELNRRISTVARRLSSFPLEPGLAIAWSPLGNEPDVILLWAIFRARGIACPIDSRIPERQRTQIMDAIAVARWLDPSVVQSLVDDSDGDRQIVGETTLDADSAATVILSSGTASSPKAVVHSLSAHFASAEGAGHNMPLVEEDAWLWSLPMFHVSGLAIVFRVFAAGAALRICSTVDDLVEIVANGRVTHVSHVPRQLRQLVDATSCSPCLKAVLLGGSTYSVNLIRDGLAAGFPIHTTYGMTESASQVTTTPAGCSSEQLMTAGKLLPLRELRLSDEGEIQLRGKVMLLGYRRNQKLVRATDESGWFSTGDVGRMDPDGWLTVVGRKDNMFVSGGENIHPEEIEAAILTLPGVRQVLVVPIPDDDFGRRPVALIEADEFSPDEFQSRLRERLPWFKIPKRYFPWPPELEWGMKSSRVVAGEFVRKLV